MIKIDKLIEYLNDIKEKYGSNLTVCIVGNEESFLCEKVSVWPGNMFPNQNTENGVLAIYIDGITYPTYYETLYKESEE